AHRQYSAGGIGNGVLSPARRVSHGGLTQATEPPEIPGRFTYRLCGDPEFLKAYLTYAEHDHPMEEWPALLGVLTLSLSGEIINLLWPSEAYLEWLKPTNPELGVIPETPMTDEDRASRVRGLAALAVRASSFGEALSLSLDEVKRREKNQRNAKRTHQSKQPIYDLYIDWVDALGTNHTYRYQSHAEADFLKWLERERPNLFKLVASRTPESMRRKLKQHYAQIDAPYPF
ncbi:hypothetical protein, partial [Parahaliea mediterranea]